MGILSVIGKGLTKKTSKESSKDVAKRGGEVMGRRDEKFMGVAEEVQPKRLGGPDVEEVAKRGGMGKAAAGVAIAGAAGAAALSGRDKEASSRSEGKGRSAQEERPTRDAGRTSSKDEEAGSKPSTFGAAFKAARAEGKDVFTYEGKKYTTEMAGEKKAAPKAETTEKVSVRETGVREGRNENIDEDTRKRAMASVANLAKGGMIVNKGIGASMKPHNMFGKKK